MFHQIAVHIRVAGAYFEGSKFIIYFCHLPTYQVYSKDSLCPIGQKWILTVDLTGRKGEASNHCRLVKFIWKPSKYGRRWRIRSEEQPKTLSKWSFFSTFFYCIYSCIPRYIFQYKIAEFGAHFKEMLTRFAECTDSKIYSGTCFWNKKYKNV